MDRKPKRPEQCELCQRPVPVLTEHHLIPKSRHQDRKLIKAYGKPFMRVNIAWLCSPCHKHIHRMLTERQLAYDYSSVDALKAHPDVADFVGWLAAKPSDFSPKTSRKARR